MIYYAEQYGMTPGSEIGKQLNQLLSSFSDVEEEKVLKFQPGTYYIDSLNCPEKELCITNTIGKGEYKKDEKRNIRRVAFYLEGVKNLTIAGENVTFVAKGRLTYASVLDSENITFEGVEFTAEKPDLHELTVEKTGLTYADFRLDSESDYICENGEFFFVGKDYKTSFTDNKVKWPYFGKRNLNDPERLVRSTHPFMAGFGIKELEKGLFRVRYINASRFKKGDVFSVYDVRRLDVGLFFERTKDIVLKGIKQRFNVSLAFVAQNCENITIDSVEFCPAENQVKQFVSYADFIQVCMCKGQVLVENSKFIGAGDDVLNVHGTHFQISEINGNIIKAKFKHPQSYGYLAFNVGDEIEFVSPSTLLAEGKAKVVTASLEDDETVKLEVDSVKGAKKGLVIENITLCPDLIFRNNYMSRIVTRGLLITTRGKVLVEGNHFNNTIMPSLLFSDDAKSWYESGPCKDVTIRNNHFGHCEKPYIQILPENAPNKNTVHGNFLIEGNTFDEDNGVDARRCESIVFKNNTIKSKSTNFVKCSNVTNVEVKY